MTDMVVNNICLKATVVHKGNCCKKQTNIFLPKNSVKYKMYVYDVLRHVVFLSQNRILWIDEKNLTAHVEAGIVGQDLERLVSTARPSILIHRKSLH